MIRRLTERRVFTVAECRGTVQRMWPYLDGALSERDKDLVADHVAACSLCHPHFVFARSFLHAVRLAHGVAPDYSTLQAKVHSALVAEGLDTAHDERQG
jgi:hypothetical protein